MVIMDRLTSYTHLIPLKDAATSEKIFKKLNCTIFDVHGLPFALSLTRTLALPLNFGYKG